MDNLWIWLVVDLPIWKILINWDDDIPNIWKKNGPNHQPDRWYIYGLQVIYLWLSMVVVGDISITPISLWFSEVGEHCNSHVTMVFADDICSCHVYLKQQTSLGKHHLIGPRWNIDWLVVDKTPLNNMRTHPLGWKSIPIFFRTIKNKKCPIH